MNDRAASKSDFADRLRGAMERKGWSMSETARRTARHLNDGEKFGRAHIWHYVQGKALPRTRYLEALSLALEVTPSELLPADATPAAGEEGGRPLSARARAAEERAILQNDKVHVRDFGDGTALLEVVQRIPWEDAIQILQILKAAPRSDK
ncbi:MAG TPA: helix-turn-helix domain-containing protein [Microvirga sp.]|jgi:transcriptional regulator with XRE-family HTH domain